MLDLRGAEPTGASTWSVEVEGRKANLMRSEDPYRLEVEIDDKFGRIVVEVEPETVRALAIFGSEWSDSDERIAFLEGQVDHWRRAAEVTQGILGAASSMIEAIHGSKGNVD